MKRIAIMGCSGSGKSTLARALGARLDLSVHHLDALFWQPGWIESDYASFTPQVQEILNRKEWIVDGGYSRADPDELRYTRVDALIVFDIPVWVCLWRVLRRWATHRNRTRRDMGPDCPEKVDWEFIRYILNYRRDVLPKILERAARNETRMVVLKRDPVIDRLLTDLEAVAAVQTSRANP